MCGIVGLYGTSPDQDLKALSPDELCEGMLGLIRHRGPDEMGYLTHSRGFLGNARLSIVDLGGGTQPISNADGTLWIAYNGEIYDCDELREQLKKLGHSFKTKTDTEIVLKLYEQYGDDFYGRLNGEFAFAILDLGKRQMLLARDPFGIRPLYARISEGKSILFASEIKPILWARKQETSLSAQAVGETLEAWVTLPPHSPFENVFQIKPNTLAVFAENGEFSEITFPFFTESPPASSEFSVRASVEKAVRRRLVADVEVGVNLSGGLDSTIVSILAAKARPDPIKTFSIEFNDPIFDESAAQHAVSQFIGSEHHAIRIESEDLVKGFRKAVLAAEAPVFRSAFVPMMLLADLIREEGVKVVLTGEGADEVFAGYDVFKEFLILSEWQRTGDDRKAMTDLGQLYKYLPQFQGAGVRVMAPFYKSFLNTSKPGQLAHAPRWSNSASVKNLLKSPPTSKTSESLQDSFPELRKLRPDQQCRAFEFLTLLHGYLLSTQGDRMSMLGSIECRLPFLDRDVVRLGLNQTLESQMPGLHEKHALVEAFKTDLPGFFASKRKQPYLAPDAELFFRHSIAFNFRDYISENAVEAQGIFQTKNVMDFVATLEKKVATGSGFTRRENTTFFCILSSLILTTDLRGQLNPSDISSLVRKKINLNTKF